MDFSESSLPVSYKINRLLPDISQTDVNKVTNILTNFREDLVDKSKYHLGYPYNFSFNYEEIKNMFDISINNLGDPFKESNYAIHSRAFEIAVLDWFAELWNISKNDYWGYITSCGTEGNLHGIYLGRENLPNGILYTSEESHYSIFKAAKMYRMICIKIKTNNDGTMNLDDFEDKLSQNKELPAIVNVNIGTTLKGGIDDLDGIINILKNNNFKESDFYIHCDGALSGIMISFMDHDTHSISFNKPISSISVSGHKFLGSPIPCGIIITRLKHISVIANDIDYINSRDATIMGSRNGHAPLFLWYALIKNNIKENTIKCIQNAKYLYNKLHENCINNLLLNKFSNTVVFEEPKNKLLIKKWQLACSNNLCHIVVMPNITTDILDEFIKDLMCV